MAPRHPAALAGISDKHSHRPHSNPRHPTHYNDDRDQPAYFSPVQNKGSLVGCSRAKHESISATGLCNATLLSTVRQSAAWYQTARTRSLCAV